MLVILAFTLLFAFPLDAAQSTPSASDPQLKTRVEQRLEDRRVRGIKVSVVHDGTVALTGSVASAGPRPHPDSLFERRTLDAVKYRIVIV